MTDRDEPHLGKASLDRGELRQATLDGVRWFGSARFFIQAATAASAVALARLVPPSAFGEAALPTALVAIATVLTIQGVATPLVQMKEISRRDVRTATTLSLGLGVVLTALSLLLAGPVVSPIFGSRIAALVRLSSPVWFMAGIAGVPQTLLERRLDFRRVSIISTVSAVVGAVTAVGLALAGLDATALVLGQMALVGARAILGIFFVGLPRPGWYRDSLRKIASTGSGISLSSLLFTAYQNVDYAILAAQLPAASVGIYWRAYQLGVGYQSKVSGVLLQLALPLYSRAADLKDMQRLRNKITQVHAATIVPCLGFFVVVAPLAVPAVFGARWTPVVEPARILAIVGVFSALMTGTGPLLVAAGRAWTLVWWNAAELVGYGLVVLVAAPHGIVVVAWAAVGYSAVKIMVLQLLVRRHVGVPFLQLGRDLLPASAATAFSMLAAEAVVKSLPDGVGGLTATVVALVAAAPVYLVALRLLFPRVGADLVLLLRQFVTRRRRRVQTLPAEAA
jgi:PST family polysaccharide transporter